MFPTTVQYDGQLDSVNAFELGKKLFREDFDMEDSNPVNFYLIDSYNDIIELEEFTIAFSYGWEEARDIGTEQEPVMEKELMYA